MDDYSTRMVAELKRLIVEKGAIQHEIKDDGTLMVNWDRLCQVFAGASASARAIMAEYPEGPEHVYAVGQLSILQALSWIDIALSEIRADNGTPDLNVDDLIKMWEQE